MATWVFVLMGVTVWGVSKTFDFETGLARLLPSSQNQRFSLLDVFHNLSHNLSIKTSQPQRVLRHENRLCTG
jgi:hypothetical protein